MNAPCRGIFPVVPKVGRCNRAAADRFKYTYTRTHPPPRPEPRQFWLIYYADVHIGTVVRSVGNCAFQRADSGLKVVERLRWALVQDMEDKTLDFWEKHDHPVDRIKAHNVPWIDRSSPEGVVDDYLTLPYRSRAMDRLLVKFLSPWSSTHSATR